MTETLSRRRIFQVAGTIVAGCAVDAFLVEPNWLDVTRHAVGVARLPRELHGYTVAQVTDAHLTSMGRTERDIIATIQARDVQLVVLTGDIIDSAEHFGVLKDFCASLRKSGVEFVATLGNWEHWGAIPLDQLKRLYSDFGVKLLVDESFVSREGVSIFATDDSTAGKPRLSEAGIDSNATARILLTHSPALWDALPESTAPYALALAGHTHGGQIRVTERAAPVRPPGSGRFVSGWYDTPAGRSYVSRGTGTSLVPARFSCRPELPLFTLQQG